MMLYNIAIVINVIGYLLAIATIIADFKRILASSEIRKTKPKAEKTERMKIN